MSTKTELLALLAQKEGRYASGQELADTLGVSRNAIWKAVKALQAQGYTYAEMERLAGVPHSTLHGLMCRHWRTGRPVKRCKRELKDRLCSIKGQRRLSQAQRVDASWMAEQLRSYRSHGVSAAEMARRIGCDRQVVDALLHGKRDRVRAETLYKFMLAKPHLDEMRKSG